MPDIVAAEHAHARDLARDALAGYGETPLVDINTLQFTPEQVTQHWLPEQAGWMPTKEADS